MGDKESASSAFKQCDVYPGLIFFLFPLQCILMRITRRPSTWASPRLKLLSQLEQLKALLALRHSTDDWHAARRFHPEKCCQQERHNHAQLCLPAISAGCFWAVRNVFFFFYSAQNRSRFHNDKITHRGIKKPLNLSVSTFCRDGGNGIITVTCCWRIISPPPPSPPYSSSASAITWNQSECWTFCKPPESWK